MEVENVGLKREWRGKKWTTQFQKQGQFKRKYITIHSECICNVSVFVLFIVEATFRYINQTVWMLRAHIHTNIYVLDLCKCNERLKGSKKANECRYLFRDWWVWKRCDAEQWTQNNAVIIVSTVFGLRTKMSTNRIKRHTFIHGEHLGDWVKINLCRLKKMRQMRLNAINI